MDNRSAQDKVCNVAELVEAILLHAELSPLDLLLARRINKTFNDVILHALPFRRALFLEADTTSTESETDPEKIEINPFLEKIFPKRTKRYFDLVLHRHAYGYMYPCSRDVLIGHGSLCKECYSNRINLAELADSQLYLHLPLLEAHQEEDYFTPAQWYQHASWRRMYATRPVLPVHVVDTSPIAHRWEVAPTTTLGEIIPTLVVGEVVFSSVEKSA